MSAVTGRPTTRRSKALRDAGEELEDRLEGVSRGVAA